MLHKEFSLVGDDLFDERHALLHGQVAAQTGIVDAAHGHGVDVLILCSLSEAVVPFAVDGLAVGLVVPVAVAFLLPLALGGIVEQQRFTMARGDDYAEAVGHDLAPWMAVESAGAGVHGRGEHIGLQTNKQFADTGVCTRAYVAKLTLVVVRGPWLQPPVLVVDEDATVAHGRLSGRVVGSYEEGFTMLHRNVSPPVPWRHAHGLREGDNSVSRSPSVAAHDEKFVAECTYDETLPAATYVGHVKFALCNELVDVVVMPKRCDDNILSRGTLRDGRAHVCHSFHVVGQHLCSTADGNRLLVGDEDIGSTTVSTESQVALAVIYG